MAVRAGSTRGDFVRRPGALGAAILLLSGCNSPGAASVEQNVALPSVAGGTSAGGSSAMKWTPSVGPKAGWPKRDACSDFEIIKNTS